MRHFLLIIYKPNNKHFVCITCLLGNVSSRFSWYSISQHYIGT